MNWILIYICIFMMTSNCQFVSIIDSPWDSYLTKPKNQESTGMCWAFATATYMETMYYKLTGNMYTLSTQQLADNIANYVGKPEWEPAFEGGDSALALFYVEEYGIMTEYNYPFTLGVQRNGKYDKNSITPIGVRHVSQICLHGGLSEKFGCLRDQLKRSVVIASIVGQEDMMMYEFDLNSAVNHAVVLTDIINSGEDIYVEYQNSWGSTWGINGRGYIRISNITGFYNNAGIFNELILSEIYDRYAEGQTTVISQKDLTYLSVLATMSSVLNILIIISVVMICIVVISTKLLIKYKYRAMKPTETLNLDKLVNQVSV